MGAIRILAPSVRDQIAAGEVVERPSSVVKELVENSLDADAKLVELYVSGGGKAGIRVKDDGVGMDQEDLALAVTRHATSKLTHLDDLSHSLTLGFRGEALAAISAVSRMVITSRPAASSSGFRLSIGGNSEPQLTACASHAGTTVEVEDLFYSVPARLKHLKTDAAELFQIQQLVTALALAYPHVAFRLTTPERVLFDVPGRGEALDVFLAAYGREVAAASLPVNFESTDGLVSVRGTVAPPEFSRSARNAETIVVNGRVIHNWALRAALEEAYRPQLAERRFPVAAIRVMLPGDRLDPNVHPQKSEVRMDDERKVAALVHRAVRETLAARSGSTAFWLGEGPALAKAPSKQVSQALEFPETATYASDQRADKPPVPVLSSEVASLNPLGQWAQKYIVAEGERGLYLIDQHAAHERVYFEKFQREFEQATVSQLLLMPLSLTVPPEVQGVLDQRRGVLESAGFDWTSLSSRSIIVRAVPRALNEAELSEEALVTILTGFSDHQGQHPWTYVMDAAAMAACKTAIKAYRQLSREEMLELFRQLAACDDPRSCPHGRPTLLHFTMEEVDRRFGRKG